MSVYEIQAKLPYDDSDRTLWIVEEVPKRKRSTKDHAWRVRMSHPQFSSVVEFHIDFATQSQAVLFAAAMNGYPIQPIFHVDVGASPTLPWQYD